MKKSILLLFILTIALFSCDSDDDNPTSSLDNEINPPAWIQGTWTDSSTGIITGYEFTVDDIKTIIGTNSTSLKASLTSSDEVNENSTSTSYQITITHTATNNSTESWQFNKSDDTHIQATHGGVVQILTKQ